MVRYQMLPTSPADVGAFVIDEVTGDVSTGLVFNASATYVAFKYRIIATDAGGLNSTLGAIVKVEVLCHITVVVVVVVVEMDQSTANAQVRPKNSAKCSPWFGSAACDLSAKTS